MKGRDVDDILTDVECLIPITTKYDATVLLAAWKRLSSENERLQGIIVKAYQHLGFTSAKNQTMRILGTGLPNAKDSERVSTGRAPND